MGKEGVIEVRISELPPLLRKKLEPMVGEKIPLSIFMKIVIGTNGRGERDFGKGERGRA